MSVTMRIMQQFDPTKEDEFMEFLPLFRRVFSSLDVMERKRMLDTVLHGRAGGQIKKKLNQQTVALWPEHLQRIEKLITRQKDWAVEENK